jgi:hypothetical protein
MDSMDACACECAAGLPDSGQGVKGVHRQVAGRHRTFGQVPTGYRCVGR